ncbi:hypothetical protein [Bacillus sp. B1-b2]|uniref:hypothetical protein n=1 Tax=Bacillus sp. B1-b2 TaxID=2653201 RepID=UPI0012627F16|nr:hypothetical protein [Bacillus sp. B1-b2]KAB7671991.1 hypothetical protein F9279_03455 [Bacillus sp. B1-b2]
MKKLQYLISTIAMVFLLAQSTIGVVSNFNTEEPSQRMEMTGQPPTMQGSTSSSSQSSTDTESSSDSSTTTDSSSEDTTTSTEGQNQMTPPNGMNGEFPGNMNGNTSPESSTASLVGYIAGIIVSLGGLVITFLTWRKKDNPSNIVEN